MMILLAIYLAMLETAEDRRKFQRLYETCEKKLYAAALKILKKPEQAEDAVQQTWLNLLKNWERVSALALDEATGYAVTTVKNAALDLIRTEKRTTVFPDDWDPPAREENDGEFEYLIDLIRRMPEGYRRILELKCVEEQSNREIARRLKLNESTVATRIQRGKAMLRTRLEQEGFEYA